MDDLPGPRGTKSSSSAAASRYAIEADRVRAVRRIHPFDPRQVSLRIFYRASGYPRPDDALHDRHPNAIPGHRRDGPCEQRRVPVLHRARAYQFYMKQARKKTLEDIDFILAHVDIDFESQAVWGDEIQVTAWPSKIGTSSFTLTYEVSEKRSGRVLARAKSVQVSYDYDKRKSKPIPPEFRRLLEDALED